MVPVESIEWMITISKVGSRECFVKGRIACWFWKEINEYTTVRVLAGDETLTEQKDRLPTVCY